MIVKIVNKSNNPLPEFKTSGSAGMDICANNPEDFWLACNQSTIIPTGIYMEIPIGFECQVRPRSGWAAKYGITVLNSPGTLDSDYRGEVGVILINHGTQPFPIRKGDRIAQLVFNKIEQPEFYVVEELESTERGTGGFGSTGIN
jgi:dUTP pyrophosphatase